MPSILQKIFIDHWDNFYNTFHSNIRPIVKHEIDKFIGCKDFTKGYALYICPKCDNTHFVPFTCKSRICSSCGSKYQMDRASFVRAKLINCYHWHIVFTIPKELRAILAKNRHLLDCLFRASADVVLFAFYSRNKTHSFTPGIVSAIHTFGRDLKWNPHIHMLVSKSALGNFKSYRDFEYINYELLRKSWQKLLIQYLNIASPNIVPKYLADSLYSNNKDGFYVNAPYGKKQNTSVVINYLIRYISKAPIAQKRILCYDGAFVTFCYDRHEDGQHVEERVSVFDFIKKIIRHIHEKYFNCLRYYGVYAKKHHLMKKMVLMFKHEKKTRLLTFKLRCLASFGRNPLRCEHCDEQLDFAYLVRDGTIYFTNHQINNI